MQMNFAKNIKLSTILFLIAVAGFIIGLKFISPLPLIATGITCFLLQFLAIVISKENSFKENSILLLTTILATSLSIFSGAKFATIERFICVFSCFALACFWVNVVSKEIKLSNLIVLATPYSIIFTSLSLNGGSKLFYPIALAHLFAIIVTVFFCFIPKYNLLKLALTLAIGYFSGIKLYDIYLQNQVGKKIEASTKNYSLNRKLIATSGDTINMAEKFKGKIVLLDFWYSKCGACFASFPDLEKISKYYINDSAVVIASVNFKYQNETNEDVLGLISNYSFNKFIDFGNLEKNNWNIEAYPTGIILDKNGMVRFKGLINYEKGHNNIYEIIEGLKRE
jgi:thiol-disulfide isomerase/thioredoxin